MAATAIVVPVPDAGLQFAKRTSPLPAASDKQRPLDLAIVAAATILALSVS